MILTLCAKLPHGKLKSKFSFIVDFAFKGGGKKFIRYLIMEQHTRERKQSGTWF